MVPIRSLSQETLFSSIKVGRKKKRPVMNGLRVWMDVNEGYIWREKVQRRGSVRTKTDKETRCAGLSERKKDDGRKRAR